MRGAVAQIIIAVAPDVMAVCGRVVVTLMAEVDRLAFAANARYCCGCFSEGKEDNKRY